MKLSDDLIQKIAHLLEEEEVDVYTLTLYNMNSSDLDFFSEKEKERIKRIFKILLEDTKRHAEFLKLIVEMSER